MESLESILEKECRLYRVKIDEVSRSTPFTADDVYQLRVERLLHLRKIELLEVSGGVKDVEVRKLKEELERLKGNKQTSMQIEDGSVNGSKNTSWIGGPREEMEDCEEDDEFERSLVSSTATSMEEEGDYRGQLSTLPSTSTPRKPSQDKEISSVTDDRIATATITDVESLKMIEKQPLNVEAGIQLERGEGTCQEMNEESEMNHNTKPTLFPCSTCGKAFDNPRSLSQHKNSAHGRKNKMARKINKISKVKGNFYGCVWCSKEFTRKDNLVRHMKDVHDRIRYSCKFCKRAFSRQYSRNTHEKLCVKSKAAK